MLVRAITLAFLFPLTALAGNEWWTKRIVLQDPVTKVLFYLESDRRHVVAISPQGKFLWCVEVMQPSANPSDPYMISNIQFENKDTLLYSGYEGGGATGEIDKKTGAVTKNGML